MTSIKLKSLPEGARRLEPRATAFDGDGHDGPHARFGCKEDA